MIGDFGGERRRAAAASRVGSFAPRHAENRGLPAAPCPTVRHMNDEDGYFGERVAATYDDPSAAEFLPETLNPMADLLAELADGGRALELGIGTGRVALPLAERGVPVHGIDMSGRW